MIKLPPKTSDAVNSIDALFNTVSYHITDDIKAAWEKIKYDLRRLQTIDRYHDLSW